MIGPQLAPLGVIPYAWRTLCFYTVLFKEVALARDDCLRVSRAVSPRQGSRLRGMGNVRLLAHQVGAAFVELDAMLPAKVLSQSRQA
ncbi:hypothetical protein HRbin36_02781 [bacterium HR36]|nr:hypothetical protein HRbin36_02781 [bacterium HR36]